MPLYSLHIPILKERLNVMGNHHGYADVISAYAKQNTYYSSAETARTAFCSILNRMLPKDRKQVAKELNELFFGEESDSVPEFIRVNQNGGLTD
ncbi:MAG: hypothetical protein J7K54_03415 [Candidatus Aenigmarchaeota archaeon]|nr:hypothetical protein [Candidatus Aenigmarchaeota archaeon]